MQTKDLHVKYAGFWIRFIASLIDTVIIGIPLILFISVISGGEYINIHNFVKAFQAAQDANPQMVMYYLSLHDNTSFTWEVISEILMASIITIFWKNFRGATPGKRIMGIKIVDVKTFGNIGILQSIIRFLGYIVSVIPLCLGFLLIAFLKDKRALHDLLAGTCVIYDEKGF